LQHFQRISNNHSEKINGTINVQTARLSTNTFSGISLPVASSLPPADETSSQLLLPQGENGPFGESLKAADLAILDAVHKAVDRCVQYDEAGPAWNGFLHVPLFTQAFDQRQSRHTTTWGITVARISSEARIRNYNNATGKIADFGFTLNDSIIVEDEVPRRLKQLGREYTGVNQTSCSPLL